MKTSTLSLAILLCGFATSMQAGEPALNLAAEIQRQALQAQANIRRAALADLHAAARRQVAALSASTPLVLAAARPIGAPQPPR